MTNGKEENEINERNLNCIQIELFLKNEKNEKKLYITNSRKKMLIY